MRCNNIIIILLPVVFLLNCLVHINFFFLPSIILWWPVVFPNVSLHRIKEKYLIHAENIYDQVHVNSDIGKINGHIWQEENVF